MIAAEIFALGRDGPPIARAVLHKSRISIQCGDRGMKECLEEFFAQRTIEERPGSGEHFRARCLDLARLDLHARVILAT